MLVDPRFAYDVDYLKEYEWDYLEEEFVELLMKSIFSREVESVAADFGNREEDSETEFFNDSNSMDVDDIWARKKTVVRTIAPELKATIKTELSHYRHNSDRPERNEDIFAWWSKNKARFPLTGKGAKIFLCVPATSVSSERTFSIAGLLYSNTLRNRMHGATAEMLILIKANLNKLKLAPSTVPDEEKIKEDESDVEGTENYD